MSSRRANRSPICTKVPEEIFLVRFFATTLLTVRQVTRACLDFLAVRTFCQKKNLPQRELRTQRKTAKAPSLLQEDDPELRRAYEQDC
jgi:hypothetical protein